MTNRYSVSLNSSHIHTSQEDAGQLNPPPFPHILPPKKNESRISRENSAAMQLAKKRSKREKGKDKRMPQQLKKKKTRELILQIQPRNKNEIPA